MTAHDITAIRTALGLTKNEFSDVLGISPHTLFRWEKGPGGVPNIDPMQRRLLLALRVQLETQAGEQMGRALRDALALGGPLKALYVLLCHVYGTAGGASAAPAEDAQRIPLLEGGMTDRNGTAVTVGARVRFRMSANLWQHGWVRGLEQLVRFPSAPIAMSAPSVPSAPYWRANVDNGTQQGGSPSRLVMVRAWVSSEEIEVCDEGEK